jgi:hypothetical protein
MKVYTFHYVPIGNGLYARVRREETRMETYRRIQRDCEHKQRDPQGTCYHCGHQGAKPESNPSK